MYETLTRHALPYLFQKPLRSMVLLATLDSSIVCSEIPRHALNPVDNRLSTLELVATGSGGNEIDQGGGGTSRATIWFS